MKWPTLSTRLRLVVLLVALFSLAIALNYQRVAAWIVTNQNAADTNIPIPRAIEYRELLEIGESMPPVQARGWLNGPPRKFNDPDLKLTLLDIWAFW